MDSLNDQASIAYVERSLNAFASVLTGRKMSKAALGETRAILRGLRHSFDAAHKKIQANTQLSDEQRASYQRICEVFHNVKELCNEGSQ